MTGRLHLTSSSNCGRQTALIWGSRQSENQTKLIVGSGEAIYDKIFLSKYDKVGSLYDNDSVGDRDKKGWTQGVGLANVSPKGLYHGIRGWFKLDSGS